MTVATLIDTTKCIGCKSCQVSCKQWNDLPGETTTTPAAALGYQNPPRASATTFTIVTQAEVDHPKKGLDIIYAKRQCMHCDEPACVSACPTTAMHKTESGAVVYDDAKCIGCRYCMWACPWGVPTAEWDSLAPKIRKCTLCYERAAQEPPAERNGVKLTDAERKQAQIQRSLPACVKQCPAGALEFGERDEMLKKAKERIAANPGKYVEHIYGEHEAGGTGTFYLSAVPFAQLGFPEVKKESFVKESKVALGAVPGAVIAVGAALGGVVQLNKRRDEVKKAEQVAKVAAAVAAKQPAPAQAEEHHHEFAPVPMKLWTPVNLLLAVLMGLGGLSLLARFAFGLGATTGLNDTYGWGLWIVFDLVWIALAAGAFVTAGLIYVFQRKDLYSIGRSAVLIGTLSYSFVLVALMADVGLPWHAYQLLPNHPEHSAMFEVAWCVGLYVSILAVEFLPVVLEKLGVAAYTEAWKKWAPVYTVFAVTTFVWMMSRNLAYTVVALAVFSLLAYAFRQKPGEAAKATLPAMAAVTLSCMHQSSLGSLFLLMPDKLDASWWSPLLPVEFLLSAIAVGPAVLVLAELWIAKGYKRQLKVQQLASLAQVTFWALVAFNGLRYGDLAYRGLLGSVLSGPHAGSFVAELLLTALVPMVLLSTNALRSKLPVVVTGAAITVVGIVLNRVDVVIRVMNLKGTFPLRVAQSYTPSFVEWSSSIGLLAATVFLFGLAARKLPVLMKEDSSHG